MRWINQPFTRIARVGLAGILVAFWVMPLVYAQDSAAISQGFTTSESDVSPGALVSLNQAKESSVSLATTKTVSELVGVVSDKSLIALNDGNNKSVQVVISGITKALVSNINGDVKSGDQITASPISGVGMRATQSTQIVGIAQTDLLATEMTARSIKDKNGTTQTVQIGLVPIQVNISYYAATEQKTAVPLFVQEFANSIAGEEVSVARIAVSALIILLGFASAGILLYASVRSSIISIGRNPLSQKTVYRSLFGVGILTIGILLVMLFAVYLILTL